MKDIEQNEAGNLFAVAYIDDGKFHPINELQVDEYKEMTEFRTHVLSRGDKEFIVFWNNRNIRRKVPSDVIMAYKTFCDMLPKEDAKKCVLVMHTAPIDNNGTDLTKVVNEMCSEYDVIFSNQKLEEKQLNFLYNIADVQINMASNE